MNPFARLAVITAFVLAVGLYGLVCAERERTRR